MAESSTDNAENPWLTDYHFPPATHNSPRTWLLTAALSPLAVRLIRPLLAHGDYVVACLPPHEIEHPDRSAEFRELINECKSSRRDREGWKDRIRGIRCDGRTMGSCGAAVAEAVQVFGRIDILLCCKSEGMCTQRIYTTWGGHGS
jgi:NAD(P)-dependent dehydrogenase (short-subunit alcohol dehydrogenase family)